MSELLKWEVGDFSTWTPSTDFLDFSRSLCLLRLFSSLHPLAGVKRSKLRYGNNFFPRALFCSSREQWSWPHTGRCFPGLISCSLQKWKVNVVSTWKHTQDWTYCFLMEKKRKVIMSPSAKAVNSCQKEIEIFLQWCSLLLVALL